MVNNLLLAFCAFTILTSIMLSSCHDDEIIDTPEIDLTFSVDTIRFDTVFTEVGTITRFVKIYNNESAAVVLDKVSIEASESDFFRMNVDGIEGSSVENIRIEGLDSLYVFIEASIDPDNPLSISPFIIEDKILIQANQSSYTVHIEAWGQNANYFPSRFSSSTINAPVCNNGRLTWNDPKPYVIYGVLAIDECNLIIEAGTTVYVHGGVAITDLGIYNDGLLIITETGTLTINGTAEKPVRFLTDRIEPEFQDVSGQWGGIIIQAGSRNNKLDHTIIRHSIVGLSVDSAATVALNSCEFAFTSGTGLSASHALVAADNCLYYQNGSSGISLSHGGSYSFNHCTVANYDNQAPALSATNFKCTDPLCQEEILTYPLEVEFTNCIFTGNEADEISLFDITDGMEAGFFNYQFNNCIVTVDELLAPDVFPNFFENCSNCDNITRDDTLFLNLLEYDHHLDTMSIALDIGIFLPSVTTDIEGNPRDPSAVDLGCYELQK